GAGVRVAHRSFAVTQHCREDVVEVMRNAAGERTHRLETLRAPQLLFDLLEVLALGEIAHDANHALRVSVRVAENSPAHPAPAQNAGGAEHAVLELVMRRSTGKNGAADLRDALAVAGIEGDAGKHVVPRAINHAQG